MRSLLVYHLDQLPSNLQGTGQSDGCMKLASHLAQEMAMAMVAPSGLVTVQKKADWLVSRMGLQ